MFQEATPPPPIVIDIDDPTEYSSRLAQAQVIESGEDTESPEQLVNYFNEAMEKLENGESVISTLRELQQQLPENGLTYLVVKVNARGSVNTIAGNQSRSGDQQYTIDGSSMGESMIEELEETIGSTSDMDHILSSPRTMEIEGYTVRITVQGVVITLETVDGDSESTLASHGFGASAGSEVGAELDEPIVAEMNLDIDRLDPGEYDQDQVELEEIFTVPTSSEPNRQFKVVQRNLGAGYVVTELVSRAGGTGEFSNFLPSDVRRNVQLRITSEGYAVVIRASEAVSTATVPRRQPVVRVEVPPVPTQEAVATAQPSGTPEARVTVEPVSTLSPQQTAEAEVTPTPTRRSILATIRATIASTLRPTLRPTATPTEAVPRETQRASFRQYREYDIDGNVVTITLSQSGSTPFRIAGQEGLFAFDRSSNGLELQHSEDGVTWQTVSNYERFGIHSVQIGSTSARISGVAQAG